jgi:hypothetical protein
LAGQLAYPETPVEFIPEISSKRTLLRILYVIFAVTFLNFLMTEILIRIIPDPFMKKCFMAINIYLLFGMFFVYLPVIYFENRYKFFTKIASGSFWKKKKE